MKTAISIPDQVFKAADKLAKRLGVSRSELYATAVESMVAKYDEEAITATLNEVYGAQDSRMEPALKSAQAKVVAKEPW